MLNSIDSQSRRCLRSSLYLALATLLWLTSACSSPPEQAARKLAKDVKQVQDFDNSLTFNAVTLEESNADGQLWWRVKAKQVSYSRDKRIARIAEPAGELYENGKVILKVSAKSGEFIQKDRKFFLRDEIKAVDLRNDLTVYGNELEWQPRNNLMLVRDNVSGDHKQLKIYAKRGKYNTKERRLVLEDAVTAVTPNQDLFMKTEKLVWLLDQQTLTSDRPVQVDRFQDKVAVAKATGNKGMSNLKAKTVTLNENAQINFLKPELQVASNSLTWMPEAQIVESKEPVTIIDPVQKVRVRGNQGKMNLQTSTAVLTGSVQGVSERRQSQLNSDVLVWNFSTQQFTAEGNVAYRQDSKPPLNLTGPRAKGELQGQTVVISGGRVETQFIP
jgi:lipopolysaccharide export system protein LptC